MRERDGRKAGLGLASILGPEVGGKALETLSKGQRIGVPEEDSSWWVCNERGPSGSTVSPLAQGQGGTTCGCTVQGADRVGEDVGEDVGSAGCAPSVTLRLSEG